MHIALEGLTVSHLDFNSFPYKATNPLSNKKVIFNEIEDVHNLLIECYDECNSKGFKEMGKALYEYSRFFANDSMLIDDKIQSKIKSYRYCKKFNCPPYPSLNETPIDIIDSFMIINDEITQYQSRKQNG